MNGMNFKTFISKVLSSLSDKELKDLADLMNSHSNEFINRSLVAGNLTADDKGVSLCTMQLDSQTIRTGYLLYSDNYCVLLGYVSNSERVMEYNINVANNTYEVVKEYLTTDYLRHEVAIKAIEAGEVGNIVAKITVNDITSISNADLDQLEAGDIVNKKTGNQLHSYRVSYKGTGAGSGICLTYTDAGYMETVSYDRSGSGWVYNSTDVTQVPSDTNISNIVKQDVEGGTLENAKPIYYHGIDIYKTIEGSGNSFQITIFNTSPEPINTINKLIEWAESKSGIVDIKGSGVVINEETVYPMYLLRKLANNNYQFGVVGPDGYKNISVAKTNLSNYFSACSDAVNKIN